MLLCTLTARVLHSGHVFGDPPYWVVPGSKGKYYIVSEFYLYLPAGTVDLTLVIITIKQRIETEYRYQVCASWELKVSLEQKRNCRAAYATEVSNSMMITDKNPCSPQSKPGSTEIPSGLAPVVGVFHPPERLTVVVNPLTTKVNFGSPSPL